LHVRWGIAARCGLGRAALCSSLAVDPGLPQLRPAGRPPLALCIDLEPAPVRMSL
jgi:hypothetical protein